MVNGSPTKTEMVDGSGGRTQLSPLTTCVVVLVVLLVLTGPLGHLPLAVLAAVVFVIGIDLVDVAGLRRLLAVRAGEFALAVLTAAAVIGLGVEQGLAAAVIASIVEHLRHSYNPTTSVLVKEAAAGTGSNAPVTPDQRSAGGLVVYRFPSNPYYANCHRLAQDLRDLRDFAGPPTGCAWTVPGSPTSTSPRPTPCAGCCRNPPGSWCRRRCPNVRRS